MAYKTLNDIEVIRGKKILLRLTLNAPIEAGRVKDDFRIKKVLPSLGFLRDKGAKTIIISHVSKSQANDNSLMAAFMYLKNYFPISFSGKIFDPAFQLAISEMRDGDIILSENLRVYEGEEANDQDFAKKLSTFGDIFVNEDFAASHRKHASIISLPKFLPSYSGFRFDEEVKELTKVFMAPRPILLVLGGAKTETKIPLLKKFTKLADKIFIGGVIANDYWRHLGKEIGQSEVSNNPPDLEEITLSQKVETSADVWVEARGISSVKQIDEISADETIVDSGPKTAELLKKLVQESRTVLWNGPIGLYERGYRETTRELAKSISEFSSNSIVGGGDTLAAISELKVEDSFTFISTGGGAMLDFLATETLPGIEALKK